MLKTSLPVGLSLLMLLGCSDAPAPEVQSDEAQSTALTVTGVWVKEAGGGVMADPQTSGLTHVNGLLASISDGSALPNQQRRIHMLDPATATLMPTPDAMGMASRVRRSCFADYLKTEPDLEALVVDPTDSTVFYTVTEDATRTGALSVRCQKRYEETGSTDYPTLLVRLKRHDDGSATMTHVRPLAFDSTLAVGDFPNDGIEGMALAPDGTLYLGLEKDAAGQPRLFSLSLDEKFWESQEFARVEDAGLALPHFDSGNHPINGLEYYHHAATGQGYILAAARNDDELWVISTDPEQSYQRISLQFTAAVDEGTAGCPPQEIMDNASIEGLAVIDQTLWLINDPWKKNYLKNVQCGANEERYKAMAPLLFSVPLQASWFN
ncbi:esterase-like activity of phytase family protein [Alteromonas salexigens]|nr:esterase-like activity of phytase family protein [Alteromonas salexigens]